MYQFGTARRILFLGGLPNLQDLGKPLIGENVREVITSDLSLDRRSLPDLKLGTAHCEQMGMENFIQLQTKPNATAS